MVEIPEKQELQEEKITLPEDLPEEISTVMVVTGKGKSGRPTSVARFILEYLQRNETGTIYDFYKGYKFDCLHRGYIPARYTSVRVIIYLLKRFGVIKRVGKPEDPMYAWIKHEKIRFKLVKGEEDHGIWDDTWEYYRSHKNEGIKKGKKSPDEKEESEEDEEQEGEEQ
jgi:hypothetical protein